MEALISKDEKILLKPNLLKRAEVEKAVITHPAVVGMFGKLLKEEGYERVILADSCGHGNTTKVIAGTGMDTYLQELGIPAVDFSEGIRTPYEEGVQAKEFILGKELLEINCVNLSVQNENPCAGADHRGGEEQLWIYLRLHKAKGHTLFPSADSFARMLIDLNQCVNPRLYIMDGITAMEGNGPAQEILLI